jgi:hypothetical protein
MISAITFFASTLSMQAALRGRSPPSSQNLKYLPSRDTESMSHDLEMTEEKASSSQGIDCEESAMSSSPAQSGKKVSPDSGLLRSTLQALKNLLINLWLITKDDSPTFVLPNTTFGLCMVLSRSLHPATCSQDTWLFTVLTRIPLVVLFNWTNLLIFDLANQRTLESAKEDALNKPWRPIPAGRLTTDSMRRGTLIALPLVFTLNAAVLGTGIETLLLFGLTWMYNDLRGGDDGWIQRNAIIAMAFGCYHWGSFRVARDGLRLSWASETVHQPGSDSFDETGSSYHGGGQIDSLTKSRIWTILVSFVIFTTMHVQDLKDVAGDRSRGRNTAMIVLGDRVARWTIAVPVMTWTLVCAWLWQLPRPLLAITVAVGGAVSWRCLELDGKYNDRRTWQIWCAWTALVWLMPVNGKWRIG